MAYSDYGTIVIDSDKVGDDETDFTILIDITDNLLKTVGNGGKVTSASGFDIVLAADQAAVAVYDFEIIPPYDGAAGRYRAWVQIPSITGAGGATLYIVFGDAGVTTSQENISGTWEANFEMVQHMEGANAAAIDDSTANNHDASGDEGNPTYQQAGKVGYAVDFDGDGDAIVIPDHADLDFVAGQDFTLEVVYKTSANATGFLLDKNSDDVQTFYYLAIVKPNGNAQLWAKILDDDNHEVISAYDNAEVYDGDWHYALYSCDRNGNAIICFDGVLKSTEAIGAVTGTLANAADLYIGDRGGAAIEFVGLIDEVRVSRIARDVNWALTMYNTMFHPDTFYSVSFAETVAVSTTLAKVIQIAQAGVAATLAPYTLARTGQITGAAIAQTGGAYALGRQAAISGAGIGSALGPTVLALLRALTTSGAAQTGGAYTLSRQMAIAEVGIASVLASQTLALQSAISQLGIAQTLAAQAVAKTLGISNQGITQTLAAQALAKTLGLSSQGLAQAEAAYILGREVALAQAGLGSGQASETLALLYALSTSGLATGVSDLTMAEVLNLSAQADAQAEAVYALSRSMAIAESAKASALASETLALLRALVFVYEYEVVATQVAISLARALSLSSQASAQTGATSILGRQATVAQGGLATTLASRILARVLAATLSSAILQLLEDITGQSFITMAIASRSLNIASITGDSTITADIQAEDLI